MLIFIYGENTFLSLKKLEAMRFKFLQTLDPSKINLFEIDIKEEKPQFGEIAQAIQSPPFLAEKRMVVLRGLLDVYSKKAEAEPWIELCTHVPESTILILWESGTSKEIEKHALFKTLNQTEDSHSYVLSQPMPGELIAWATARAKELALNIRGEQIRNIVEMVGSDMWQLSSELEKLAAFAGNRAVTLEDIGLLVNTNTDDKMFTLMDAISERDNAKVLKLLTDQRQFGTTDGMLFVMLCRQARLLLGARDVLDRNPKTNKQAVADELNIHPFVAQKILAQARKFDFNALVKLQNLLFELDKKIKHSAVTERVAVDRVVAEILF